MLCYASRTGTLRNLAVLRAYGWRLFVSRAGRKWRREGLPWAADNGAWADHQAGRDFDEDEYDEFLDWIATQQVPPDFIVLPDIVAGGLASLALSTRYINRCLSLAPLVLIAVQDGMEHHDLAPLVGPSVGIFLGGSTEWKIARMQDWGEFCAELRLLVSRRPGQHPTPVLPSHRCRGALDRRVFLHPVRDQHGQARPCQPTPRSVFTGLRRRQHRANLTAFERIVSVRRYGGLNAFMDTLQPAGRFSAGFF